MNYDLVICGVGGQGVLSIAWVIDQAAVEAGFHIKQPEVHGMAQRGGAVLANLRLADGPIASDLIPRGRASLVLSMEPLESLRYLEFLSPEGSLITSSNPVKNIPDYPAIDDVLAEVRRVPRAVLIDGEKLARQAGSVRAVNMVMVGAASNVLPLDPGLLERYVGTWFASKGPQVVEQNLRAFRAGREAAAS
jgi:indolepyruvate ferredoxin oxidoreductase beta subunit